MSEIKLWLWQYTDEFGKRRVTRYWLSEEEAAARLIEPIKVEGSLLITKPTGSTDDSPKSPTKS
jgi:hypothetical protein